MLSGVTSPWTRASRSALAVSVRVDVSAMSSRVRSGLVSDRPLRVRRSVGGRSRVMCTRRVPDLSPAPRGRVMWGSSRSLTTIPHTAAAVMWLSTAPGPPASNAPIARPRTVSASWPTA